MEKINAKVTGVDITKFEGQEYSTISLRLNKNIKKMSETDAGTYEEINTPFVSMPISAFLATVNDDSINYYLATKGADVDNVKAAFAGAEVTVSQTLVGAGKTEGNFENTKDHDVYFNVVSNVKPSKLAIIKIAAELGIDPNYLIG